MNYKFSELKYNPTDYEALKNGTKEIVDLRKHFDNRDKDEFYLGLIDTEPEW